MSYEINDYTPAEVTLTFGGYRVEGWDQISIERSSPVFRQIKGIRGKHTRVREFDSSATITFGVLQTSSTNDYLSEILRRDEEWGTGRLSILLKDKSGNSVFSSEEGYIVGYPKADFGEEIVFRPWTIFCQSTVDFTVGGNDLPPPSAIKQAIELFK